jgi:crotonobetainyl-CoA:carnitine CoA-transferase CaiB-like acyl-CoA transferase
VHEIPDRRGGSYLIHGYPWRFSDDELGMRNAPAFRGEDNEQVFRNTGMSEWEIREAIDAGILVGGPPSSKEIDAAVPAEARSN